MTIKILAVGKKHEEWVAAGIARYSARLRKPFAVTWQLLPHSTQTAEQARQTESQRILRLLDPRSFLLLLDERGTNFDSRALSSTVQKVLASDQPLVIVIGGAYGVSAELRQRANAVWSLSALVFPHQLVRLILIEQLYRAQEIAAGKPYHHD